MSGSAGSSDDDLREFEESLRSTFETDPFGRFRWEGRIGAGGNGTVFRVQRSTGIIAIKVWDGAFSGDDDGDDSEDEDNDSDELNDLRNEANWLEKLRNCPHVIKKVDLNPDPLTRFTAWRKRFRNMPKWLYMEYAENGVLQSFIDNHYEMYGGVPFPNRLLWRFFMCLVRMVLEMGYYSLPIDFSTIDLPGVADQQLGPLAHTDVKGENIVIGNLLPSLQNPEHVLTPILKLIDFGSAQEITDPAARQRRLGGEVQEASEVNVNDIGLIMMYLLIHGSQGDTGFGSRITITLGAQTFDSWCGPLAQRRAELLAQGVDDLLISTVCRCLAVNPKTRPTPIQLANAVRERVLNRGSNGNAAETDNAIEQLLRNLLFNPAVDIDPDMMDVDPPGGGGGGGGGGSKRPRDDDNDDDDDDGDDRGTKRPRGG